MKNIIMCIWDENIDKWVVESSKPHFSDINNVYSNSTHEMKRKIIDRLGHLYVVAETDIIFKFEPPTSFVK